MAEIILVVAILGLILAISLPVGWNFYFDYQLNSERELLKSVLKQAENLSFINHNESRHGVYINSDNFILFEGNTFASRNSAEDRFFARTKSISVSGPTEIVFETLSAKTASSTYSLNNSQKTLYLYINSEGTIYD